MPGLEVAHFGQKGSFSSVVARKRYPDAKLVPVDTIPGVLDFVEEERGRLGVVPVENSSGGMIKDTIESLIKGHRKLLIQEELGLKVKLAFLGRKGEKIKKIYSHFAPIDHCDQWIKKNYPKAEIRTVESTSEAAKIASKTPNSGVLASPECAELFKLDVLVYPVLEKVLNFTQFFTLGHEHFHGVGEETSIVVALKDEPGSLCRFLSPFSKNGLNLKRIYSSPIEGHPNTYLFFIGIEAANHGEKLRAALNKAGKYSKEIRELGSYPVRYID